MYVFNVIYLYSNRLCPLYPFHSSTPLLLSILILHPLLILPFPRLSILLFRHILNPLRICMSVVL